MQPRRCMNSPETNTVGNRYANGGGWARYVNVAASVWLFLSAFAWPHAAAARADTWITAVLMFVVAIWAIEKPMVRYANTVLAAWLFLSTPALRGANNATLWNNLIVAIVVFIFSLISSQEGTTTPNRPATPRPS